MPRSCAEPARSANMIGARTAAARMASFMVCSFRIWGRLRQAQRAMTTVVHALSSLGRSRPAASVIVNFRSSRRITGQYGSSLSSVSSRCRRFATDVYLPNLSIFGPLVFLAELAFAVSVILGLGVRLVSTVAVLYVLHLWLGIYQSGDPAEWPWSYVFLAALMFLFAVYAAGRSLGADAWLRRHAPPV